MFGQTVALTIGTTGTPVSNAATPTGNQGDTINVVDAGAVTRAPGPLAVTPGTGANPSTSGTGTANLTTSATLAAEVASLTAQDTNATAPIGNSTAQPLVVSQANTSVGVTPLSPSVVSSQAISFTAKITDASGTGEKPTGSVQFEINSAETRPPGQPAGGSRR